MCKSTWPASFVTYPFAVGVSAEEFLATQEKKNDMNTLE
jgi:hypothetical protein